MKTIDHFHSGKISTAAGLRYCPKVLLHIHTYEIPQGRSSLDWQGKDMDRKVLCTGQFFQPLVLDAGPRQVNLCKKDTSRLKDLRVKQTSPFIIYLVSGKTSCTWTRRIWAKYAESCDTAVNFNSASPHLLPSLLLYTFPIPITRRKAAKDLD